MIANDISRIIVIGGGDHDQGAFRFSMTILFVTNYKKTIERLSNVAYILCKKCNRIQRLRNFKNHLSWC